MLDATDLVRNIKKIAVEAVEATSPSDSYIGSVISINPIKIKLDQKIILSINQLILTKNVTDYEVDIEIDDLTEFYEENPAHNHQIKGRKTIKVYNSLKQGENVLLIAQKGGQKYIVADRVV